MYGLDVWNEIEVTLGSEISELHKINNLQTLKHLHTFQEDTEWFTFWI